MKRLLIEGNA